jgi:hypothetical protein
MKKLFLFFIPTIFSISLLAQGNSGKGKDKQKDKDKPSQVSKTGNPKNKEDKQKNDEHDRKVWEGIGDNSCMKSSKNQPAKVRAAFQRDYPSAFNVRWTKCRGDWTASFNGSFFRSTAVYHANGDRRDTRTPVTRDNIPRRILDEILKRLPGNRVDAAIKIEIPNAIKEIFRIKAVVDGTTRYDFYNSDGVQVTYNY